MARERKKEGEKGNEGRNRKKEGDRHQPTVDYACRYKRVC